MNAEENIASHKNKNQQQGRCHRHHIEERHAPAVMAEKRPQGRRPDIFFIGLDPQLRHDLGDVQVELMGRGVLAGMEAVAAVVAEIGQIFKLTAGE